MSAPGEPVVDYSDADLEKFMNAALVLVKEVGEMINKAMLLQRQEQTHKVTMKVNPSSEGHSAGILTETDSAVERHLVKGLSQLFPDHKFIGEEAVSEENGMISKFSNKPTWIIDPIDGTMNFVHTTPLVCTSIGLAINRKMVLGIVNNPVTHQVYTAIKGKGAYLNGDIRLKTSGVKSLGSAMVLMELPSGANEKKKTCMLQNVSTFMDKSQAIRCPGKRAINFYMDSFYILDIFSGPAALDMAWVGSGYADAFYHFTIHCWDMVAGKHSIIKGLIKYKAG